MGYIHNNLKETLALEGLDLSGIKINDSLDPKFFDKNLTLSPKIKENLLKLIEKFVSHVDFKDLNIQDIVLTGSIANYNYNENSDVDIHILSDFSQYKIEPEILTNLFKEKKDSWANKYDITIYGHPVELYIEDINVAMKKDWVAMYSIKDDKFLQLPLLDKHTIDYETLELKSDDLAKKIDTIITKHSNNEISNDAALSQMDTIKEKIKKLRDVGLNQKHSELAIENLIFKVLRNNGYFDKMNEFKKKIFDKEFTIKEKKLLVLKESQYNTLKRTIKNNYLHNINN